jgi:hypothetical protein
MPSERFPLLSDAQLLGLLCEPRPAITDALQYLRLDAIDPAALQRARQVALIFSEWRLGTDIAYTGRRGEPAGASCRPGFRSFAPLWPASSRVSMTTFVPYRSSTRRTLYRQGPRRRSPDRLPSGHDSGLRPRGRVHLPRGRAQRPRLQPHHTGGGTSSGPAGRSRATLGGCPATRTGSSPGRRRGRASSSRPAAGPTQGPTPRPWTRSPQRPAWRPRPR